MGEEKPYYTKEEMNNLFYTNEELDKLLQSKQDVLNDDITSPDQNLKRINNESLKGKGSITVLTEHQSLDDYYKKSEIDNFIRANLRNISTYSLEFCVTVPMNPLRNVIYAIVGQSMEGAVSLRIWDGKWYTLDNIIDSSLGEYARNDELRVLLDRKQDVLIDEGLYQNIKKLDINGEKVSILGAGDDIYIPLSEHAQADWNAEELLPDGTPNPAHIKNKPSIPTKTSQLFNNGYFATKAQVETSYYNKDDADNRIDEKIGEVKGFHPEVLDVEPVSPVKDQIYLVKNEENKYDIFVYILDEFSELKKIKLGTSDTNYDDYLLKSDFDDKLSKLVLKELVEGSTERYKGLSSNDFTDDYKNFLDNDIKDYKYDDSEIKNILDTKQVKSNISQDIKADTGSVDKYPSVASAEDYVSTYMTDRINELNADSETYPINTDKTKLLLSKNLINDIIEKILKMAKKDSTVLLSKVPELLNTIPVLDDLHLFETKLTLKREKDIGDSYVFSVQLNTHWDNNSKYSLKTMEGVLTGADIVLCNGDDLIGEGKTDETGKLTFPAISKETTLGDVYAQYITPGIFPTAVSNDIYMSIVLSFTGNELNIQSKELFAAAGDDIKVCCEGQCFNYDYSQPFVVQAQKPEELKHEVYIIGDNLSVGGSFVSAENNLIKVTLTDEADIDGSFKNVKGLSEVVITDTTSNITESSFEGSSIEKVKIPSWLRRLDPYTFKDCTSLSEVKFPKEMKEHDFRIFTECFTNTNIKKIVLPVNCIMIGSYVFADCQKLEDVTFNAELKSISNGAFGNCINLIFMRFLGEEPPILGDNCFANVPDDCIVYVPRSSVDDYTIKFGEAGYRFEIKGF